jgi:hypothetical protein
MLINVQALPSTDSPNILLQNNTRGGDDKRAILEILQVVFLFDGARLNKTEFCLVDKKDYY